MRTLSSIEWQQLDRTTAKIEARRGDPLALCSLVTVVVLSCAFWARAVARAEIAPGEVVVRTADGSSLTTASLSKAAGRDDFFVKQKDCVLRTCHLVLERRGAPADADWTYELIDALETAELANVDGIEPNFVAKPQ